MLLGHSSHVVLPTLGLYHSPASHAKQFNPSSVNPASHSGLEKNNYVSSVFQQPGPQASDIYMFYEIMDKTVFKFFLLDRGPFCGANGTLCFGFRTTLFLNFKDTVYSSSPALWSLVYNDHQSHLWFDKTLQTVNLILVD